MEVLNTSSSGIQKNCLPFLKLTSTLISHQEIGYELLLRLNDRKNQMVPYEQ